MKTIAVTIGIATHGPYDRLARWSCDFVEKNLELETRIIGDEFLSLGVGRLPQSTVKLAVFEIFKDADRIMFFDADWRPVRKFNLFDYCPDPKKLYFTLDEQHEGTETPTGRYLTDLENRYNLKGRYFNGGFFVATREYHSHLFQKAKENYWSYNEECFDQCVMNQAFNSEVTLADKRLNVKRVSFGFRNCDVLGYHNVHNHQIMEGWTSDPDWNSCEETEVAKAIPYFEGMVP